jgi:carbon storage regulator CsrA
MLVLSRKIEDEIIIDDRITIRVLKVKGNTVRLGISAPSDVEIMRGELPRREVEFTLKSDDEPEPQIRFERHDPPSCSRNRLSEIVSQINAVVR